MLTMAELKVGQYLARLIVGAPTKIIDPREAENLIRAFEKCMAEIKKASTTAVEDPITERKGP